MACVHMREMVREAARVCKGESEGSGSERAKVGEEGRMNLHRECGERDSVRDHEAGEGKGA